MCAGKDRLTTTVADRSNNLSWADVGFVPNRTLLCSVPSNSQQGLWVSKSPMGIGGLSTPTRWVIIGLVAASLRTRTQNEPHEPQNVTAKTLETFNMLW